MDLSVVRIHKANSSTGSPWVHTRPVVHPDKYLSQSPFILLNEESYTPNSEFPIQCHKGIVAVTLVLDGALKQTDAAGSQLQLNHGDADITMGDGGLLRGKTPGESGVRLLHLWLDLPAGLKSGDSRHSIVRHDSARRAAFGDASALVYAGTLGEAYAPHVSPWPITMADMHLPCGAVATLPLASTERSFVYVLAGDVEAGRNKVRLNRGSVAWIERTTEPDHFNPLPVHADKDARFLIFSSPVIEGSTST